MNKLKKIYINRQIGTYVNYNDIVGTKYSFAFSQVNFINASSKQFYTNLTLL